jgi:mono/diheme cytochrome c family protein
MSQIFASLCLCIALLFALPFKNLIPKGAASAQSAAASPAQASVSSPAQTDGAPTGHTTDAPAVDARTPEFHAERSPERLARGKYLVTAVAHCFECHGDSDFGTGLGQPKPGTEGAGQIIRDEDNDYKLLPDAVVVPNITPDKETGAGTWADWQFERAIRHGIGHDGRKLIDFMPYAFFRSFTDEDVASVIVYIRSLPAVKHQLPKMRVNFEVQTDMLPQMEPVLPPDASEQLRHGWYLARVAQCNGCHTPYDEKGAPVADKMFGGGLHLKGDWGDVVTPNITCHASGISHYDTAMFIKTIRTGRGSAGVRDLATVMPYSYFRRMSDEDLSSIFAFIHSVKPVFHEVDNSEPATYCTICKQKHGLGDRN